MKKSSSPYWFLINIAVVTAGLPGIFGNLLEMAVPSWVYLAAIIAAFGLMITCAVLERKHRNNHKQI